MVILFATGLEQVCVHMASMMSTVVRKNSIHNSRVML